MATDLIVAYLPFLAATVVLSCTFLDYVVSLIHSLSLNKIKLPFSLIRFDFCDLMTNSPYAAQHHFISLHTRARIWQWRLHRTMKRSGRLWMIVMNSSSTWYAFLEVAWGNKNCVGVIKLGRREANALCMNRKIQHHQTTTSICIFFGTSITHCGGYIYTYIPIKKGAVHFWWWYDVYVFTFVPVLLKVAMMHHWQRGVPFGFEYNWLYRWSPWLYMANRKSSMCVPKVAVSCSEFPPFRLQIVDRINTENGNEKGGRVERIKSQ